MSDSIKMFLDAPDFLQTVLAEGEKNNEAARDLTSGLNENQLNWKPSADRWSIAQCLAHLSSATSGFKKYFDATLENARKKSLTTAAPPYKPSLVGGWLAKQVSPEGERKLPAPKIFRPNESSNIQGSLAMFLKEQEWFLNFVRQCQGIDYNRARLRSPVTPLMRYSLADAFVITVVHGQRHLAQGRRVHEMAEFPRS